MRSIFRALLLGALLSAVLAPAAGAVITRTAHGRLVSFQPLAETGQQGSLAKRAPGAARRAQRRRLRLSLPGAARTLGATGTQCTFSSSSFLPCLGYHDGPVMTTTTVTPIYWDPGNSIEASYKGELEQFFTDLSTDNGHSGNFFSVLPQYYEQSGGSRSYVTYHVSTGSGLNDSDPYPTGSGEATCTDPFEPSRPCITDTGLVNELGAFIEAEHLPIGLGHEYVVYFPRGVDTCFTENTNPGEEDHCSGTEYCAYHGALAVGGGLVAYANEAEDADPMYGGGCSPQGAFGAQASINTTSHEVSESVTDPLPGSGWYDEGPEPGTVEWGEIGDICAWSFEQGYEPGTFPPPASGANQTINGDGYMLQTEWDNGRNTCSVSAADAGVAPPEPQLEASPGGSAPTGTPIAFDGRHSSAATGYGIVSYSWSFGDGTSSSEAAPSHVFATSGGAPSKAYEVTLTVVDSIGQSASVTRAVTVTDRAPKAVFNPPAGVVAGTAASFEGSTSSDPDGHVVSYDWSWGDGSPDGAGATASHTFATAGAYTVTLTVTDDAGSQERTSALVTVAAAPSPPPPPVVTPASQTASQGVLGFSTGQAKTPAKAHKKHKRKHKKRKHGRARRRKH